ncbi:MAG: acetyltransferase, ribosomal protein N-acetylase [Acidobacteria bacterium]|nr:acetyltransferase, ribosomal protein N-acetylase [Acidobacteriota bacterium]
MRQTIQTPRLELRGGTLEIFSIPFDDRDALARALNAEVPDDWPVENYDQAVLDWSRGKLGTAPDSGPPIRYVILRESNTLIGIFGDGHRTDPGTLVIGYSILPAYRRRGYASEALAAVIDEAFAGDDVTLLVADTYPELAASIGVLEKNGFRLIGGGEEERTIRYQRSR